MPIEFTLYGKHLTPTQVRQVPFLPERIIRRASLVQTSRPTWIQSKLELRAKRAPPSKW